jgi:hypothetical protein
MMIMAKPKSVLIAALTFFCAVTVATAVQAEPLQIRLDKAEILRLPEPASVIFVGNPDIADVTIESPTLIFIIGRSAGETNLIIFDDAGEQTGDFDLVVLAEHERHVTVNRSTDLLSTFNCDPRCIEVENPSEVERQRQFSDGDNDDDEEPFSGGPAVSQDSGDDEG